MENRRQDVRWPGRVPTIIALDGEPRRSALAQLVDLSISGAGVLCEEPLRPKSKVDLLLPPTEESVLRPSTRADLDPEAIWLASGEIVRAAENPNEEGLWPAAISFEHVETAKLDELIEQLQRVNNQWAAEQ